MRIIAWLATVLWHSIVCKARAHFFMQGQTIISSVRAHLWHVSGAGEYLVSCGWRYDNAICLWRWRDAKLLCRQPVNFEVTCLSFTPDSRHVVQTGAYFHSWAIHHSEGDAKVRCTCQEVCRRLESTRHEALCIVARCVGPAGLYLIALCIADPGGHVEMYLRDHTTAGLPRWSCLGACLSCRLIALLQYEWNPSKIAMITTGCGMPSTFSGMAACTCGSKHR